jgi:RHS repeat-associated protein
MKTRLVILVLTLSLLAFAQYQYDYVSNPMANVNGQYDTTHWNVGGTEAFWQGGQVVFNGTTQSTYGPIGSMLYSQTVSGTNPNDYELDATLQTTYYNAQAGPPYSGGASYAMYFRMLQYQEPAGCTHGTSYISAEIDIPIASAAYYGDYIWGGTLVINQCHAGTLTALASMPNFLVWNGMTLKGLIYDGNNLFSGTSGTNLCITSSAPPSDVIATLGSRGLNGYNGFQCWSVPSGTTGNPGIGGTGGSEFLAAAIGHYYNAPPAAVSQGSVATSVFPSKVSMRWQGVAPNQYGVPILGYMVWRNGALLSTSQLGPNALNPWQDEFTDATVQPSTTYTYSIRTVDYHCNLSSATTITVTTPPTGAVDPRRIGVRPNGSYWGGAGEQLDTLSGNLNFSIPLVNPQSRTGAAVPLNLTYNSQNWLQDTGVNWKEGDDIGYGFGWKVEFGSITPYYTAWGGIDHLVYTDGTGAEYLLTAEYGPPSAPIWTSPDIHVWFDANANILHFPDGSHWTMGSISGGNEQDAGTMYPTIMEGVSGNQIIVDYDTGAGLPSGTIDTSGRITAIEDVRATGCPTSQWTYTAVCSTYTFTYTKDSNGTRLSSIANSIGTAETWNFTYSLGQSVEPPFGSDPTFAGLTKNTLGGISTPGANSYGFSYDSAGAGELTQVAFPFGGHLRWAYITDAYSGSRYLRAIGTRYLAADSAGATEWTYPITWDNAANAVVHGSMTLADASGIGSKTWNFVNTASAPAWQIGLSSEFIQKPSPSSAQIYTDDTYTWSQDPGTSGTGTPMVLPNPYISSKTSLIDENTPNQQSVLATQVHDVYGNVTQALLYPFNNVSTPLKTYTNMWLQITYAPSYYYSGGWNGGYIFNRLLTASLSMGGTNKTLVQNYYDGQTMSGQPTSPCGSSTPRYGGYYADGPTMDSNPFPAFAYQGHLTASITPAVTTCSAYYGDGVLAWLSRSDGATGSVNPASSTNYAAPQSITTQSYGQSMSYNAFLGVTQTTGLNGETMTMTYDRIGRPAAATSPYSMGNGTTATYAYSNSGVIPVFQQESGPDGVTITTLDGVGRPIHTQRGNTANVDSSTSFVDTVYAPYACAPLGMINKASQPYANGATPKWTTYTYDGIGRTLTVQQPDGASTTTYSYSGNQTTATDPAGNWKQFAKDVQGNLITVLEADPNNAPLGTQMTSYTYDWMNNLIGVTMTRGVAPNAVTQTRTFVYADFGLLTSATNPENGTVTYTWNSDNTLQYKHDAKGQDTVYTYDNQKRLTMMQRYPTGKANAEDQCQRVTYTYDNGPYDNAYTQFGLGRLTSASYGPVNSAGASCIPGVSPTTIQEIYSYHPAGAVTQKTLLATRASNRLPLQVSYAYDTWGRNSTVSYPMAAPFNSSTYTVGPTTFTYNYYFERALSLTDGNNWTWVRNAQYDYANRLTSFQYLAGAGVYSTRTLAYNDNSQITSIGWSTPSGYGPTGSIAYGFSTTQNNGKLAQAVDGVSGETITYGYDALNRLISAVSNPTSGGTPAAWSQTFQYDGFDNLTSKTLNGSPVSIPVDPATNHLLPSTAYDGNGNLTSGVGASFTYDEANRMSSATLASGGGTEYYFYAPDNKRIYRLKADGVTEEWTFYGAKGERLGVYVLGSSGFTPLRTDVNFAGTTILNANSGAFTDRTGSNRSSGARYYPYGDEITSPPTTNDREKFASYTRDGYTGLDYADQRYYATAYGTGGASAYYRFLTPDPSKNTSGSVGTSSDPSSWNMYSYTRGDPVNRIDPGGTDDCDLDCPAIGNCPMGYVYCSNGAGYSEGDLLPASFQNATGCGYVPPDQFNPGVVMGCLAQLSTIQNLALAAQQAAAAAILAQTLAPPALTCQSDGFLSSAPTLMLYSLPGQPSLPYYGVPVSLPFFASGGIGTYTWGITQTYTSTATDINATGSSSTTKLGTESLSNVADIPNGPRSIFDDAPGLAVNPGNFTAIGTFAFTDVVTATSGTQTIQCPTMKWSAWEIIIQSATGTAVTGAATASGR